MKVLEVLTAHARRRIFCLLVLLTFSVGSLAQSAKPRETKQPAPAPAPQPPQRSGRVALGDKAKVTLADVNVEIISDPRVIAMMAALNAAGYDFESGNRQLSNLRQQLREDLKNINPSLARRLKDYFVSHNKGRSEAAAVAPYLSLALTLTAAPSFAIDGAIEKLPDDVREITDFALLLEEFYRDTKFGSLLSKYAQAYEAAAKNYGPATAASVANVIQYLHTEPILELPPAYVSRAQAGKRETASDVLKSANRMRKFVVMPDLLNSSTAVNLRVVRDTYYIFIGSSVETGSAVRKGFLRFVLDPLVEKQVKEVSAIRTDLKKLSDSRGEKLGPEYRSGNAYFQISDSLSRAIDTRIESLESLMARRYVDEKAFTKALNDETERGIYELSFAYERGSVLVYHFYDQMMQAEEAGLNLGSYLGSLLQNIKFDKEMARLTDNAQRIERYKAARELAAKNAPNLGTAISNADQDVVAKIEEADRMVRVQQYNEARTILKNVLQQKPNNARAYYGLAEIGSKVAVKIEDEARRDEELYAAVQYYKDATENASSETEKWLIQRSYVAAAKILDFLNRADDATAAFDLAIKMGEVPNGAYQDALKAVKARPEQKPKP